MGFPYGTNGGSYIWDRRPMNREELEHCAKAVAAAARTLVEALGEMPELTPEDVLDGLSLDDLKFLAKDWPAEADREAERRRQMVVDAIEKRLK